MSNKSKAGPFGESVAVADEPFGTPKKKYTTMILKGSDDLIFEPLGVNNMQVQFATQEMPPAQCPMFNDEWVDHMRQNGMTDTMLDAMYKGVEEGYKRGQLLDALLNAIESLK